MDSFELKGAVTGDICILSNLADVMWLNSGVATPSINIADESVWTNSRCTSSGDRYLFVSEHSGVASRICWCISHLGFAFVQ